MVQLLTHLRLVFWQDLPLIFAKYPHLMIFKSGILSQHWTSFRRWCQLVEECMTEQKRILDQAGGPPSVLLKQHEGVGNIILSMQIVPNTFRCPESFKMRSVPGSKFFSFLERVSFIVPFLPLKYR